MLVEGTYRISEDRAIMIEGAAGDGEIAPGKSLKKEDARIKKKGIQKTHDVIRILLE